MMGIHDTMSTVLCTQRESIIRDMVAKRYSGQTGVKCAAGIIDVLTPLYVVVVKNISEWKHAVGSALVYSIDTHRKPAVYLFIVDNEGHHGPATHDIARIMPYLERLGVVLMNDDHVSRPFSDAPDESIAGIVTYMVTHSTAGIRTLALNKRIHRITQSLWPSLLRARLHFMPKSQYYEQFCAMFCAPMLGDEASYAASVLPSSGMWQYYTSINHHVLPPFYIASRGTHVHITSGKYIVQFLYEHSGGLSGPGTYRLGGYGEMLGGNQVRNEVRVKPLPPEEMVIVAERFQYLLDRILPELLSVFYPCT